MPISPTHPIVLWLGPDGFETIREFTAPRIVIVSGK